MQWLSIPVKADPRSCPGVAAARDARACNRKQLEFTFGVPVMAHVRIVYTSIDQDFRQRFDDVSGVGRTQHELM